MKAIKVTQDNKSQLLDQFENLTEESIEECVGYWLLANFGQEDVFEGFIFDDDFGLEWKKVRDLQNGWIEVTQ